MGYRIAGFNEINGLEFCYGERLVTSVARTLHVSWEILVCSAGTAELITNDGEIILAAKTMVVIPPYTAHSIRNLVDYSFCALRLEDDLTTALLGKQLAPPAVPVVKPSDEALVWRWLCKQLLLDQPAAIYESALVGALRTILEPLRKNVPPRVPLPDRIARMRAQLEHRLNQDVSLAELGDHVELSRFHAARLFKADMGVSPHEYQLLLRIARAKRLLLEGQTATHVAAQVGFSDQSHLHRYFKRYVHVTPGEYRRWMTTDSKKIQAEIRECMGSFFL